MTDNLFTVGEMADRLALYQAHPADYYARQIRTWVQIGLLRPVTRGVGRTAPAKFNPEQVFEAQILSVLADLNWSPSLTAEAMDLIRRDSLTGTLPADRADSLRVDGGWQSNGVVRDAIRGIAAEEMWEFRFSIMRDSDRKVRLVGEVVRQGEVHEIAEGLDAALTERSQPLATTTLCLNEIFAPVIAAMVERKSDA